MSALLAALQPGEVLFITTVDEDDVVRTRQYVPVEGTETEVPSAEVARWLRTVRLVGGIAAYTRRGREVVSSE